SYEIAKDVKVTQKSAWFMLHRIRLAMQDKTYGNNLSGHVEVDETFIGGKARNMHLDKRERRITGTGGKDKTIVFGALERGGKIRTAVISDRKRAALQVEVKSMSKRVPRCTPMPCSPMTDSRKNTLTKLSTMPKSTSTGRFTLMALRTSGACSSAASLAPTLVLSLSIYFATSMSKCSATTFAATKRTK